MGIAKTSIDDCVCEGERLIFKFFKDKLPNSYTFWNNLEIDYIDKKRKARKTAEIDFILYNNELGLFIFSVKDWQINQIEYIENNLFYRKNNPEPNNPLNDARRQFIVLKGYLESKNELLDFSKRIKFPINYSLFFPYINKKDFEDKINKISPNITKITQEQTTKETNISIYLFRDLFKNERASMDKFFVKHIFDNLRYIKFKPYLTNKERDFLFDLLTSFSAGKTREEKLAYPVEKKDLIFAVPEIPEKTEEDDDIFVTVEDTLIKLDKTQVGIANSFLESLLKEPKHLILKGTAGSGKTIILLQMFYKLAKKFVINDTHNFRIAYISRQHSLANDFKQKIKSRNIDIDKLQNSGCFIGVFHEFFQIFFSKQYWELEKDKNNFPTDEAMNKFIEKNINSIPEFFDFVFIDEGHNLPDMWIKFIIKSTKGCQNGKIIYAEDQQQNIYGIKRDYMLAGLDTNTIKTLNINYRNTHEIYKFALQFCEKLNTESLENLKLISQIRHGRKPEIIFARHKFNDLRISNTEECKLKGRKNILKKLFSLFKNKFILFNKTDEKTAKNIALCVFEKFERWLNEGFQPNEIVLIYPVAKIKDRQNILLLEIFNVFIEKGFYFKHTYTQSRITGKFPDKYSKYILPYDTKNYYYKAINLVTAMSSQGLSYKCVILILDGFESISWLGKQEILNMLYTSVTRATHELLLAALEENQFSRKAVELLGMWEA